MQKQFLAVFWRDMKRFVRFRAQLFSSLVQPIIWMLFFGLTMSSNFDKFSSMIPIPPGAVSYDYLTFMGSGIIGMTLLFTCLFGGMVLIFDKNWGLMREMVAAPMSRMHILYGISLSGIVKSSIQALIIIIVGLILGADFFSGQGATEIIISSAGIFLTLVLFGLGFLFLSAAISMKLNSMEGIQGVMTLLTMPIFFSSNALYPIDAFPEWLKIFANINPLTYLIKGIRYFLLGPDFFAMGTHYTYTSGDLIFSWAVLAVFAFVMFLFARHSFKKAVIT